MQPQGDAAGTRDVRGVAEQAEPGDVGRASHAERLRRLGGDCG